MDIFGIKEHDEKHSEMERILRRLVEQVGQLSIDLGVTRTELRRLTLDVQALAGDSVLSSELDPSILQLNETLKGARVRLAAAQEAAEKEWSAREAELSEALSELRDELNASE